ncbi:MAG: AraC family ligand binding domain-containing protein [Atribacterota bacterium]|jgi:mannose-6-phosphate isomerase-like protein (cupin superfamily)|nr:AraC family ligand binding domain-containing protein [Atribacterota bacterium]
MKIKKSQELNGIQVPKPFSRKVRVIFSPDVDVECGCNLIRATIFPFSKTDYRHRDRTEIVFIVSGKGTFVCNDQEYSIESESALLIEKGDKIQIINTENQNLDLVSFYPNPYNSYDIYQKLLEAAEVTQREVD